jgi:hypothetical protein
MNENKFPGAVTIGYMTIFISSFYFGLIWSGWVQTITEEWVTIVLIFNVLLIVAGLFSLSNTDKIDVLVFLTLGANWIGFILRFIWYPNIAANSAAAVMDGWICFLLTIVFFCTWFASLKGNLFRKLFLLGLWLGFLAATIWNWFSVIFFMNVFAYLSLITAILAGIYGASTIIDFKKAK